MFHCHLIGGDTDRTPGPLSVSITAFGSVPAGRMVRRSTARPGDLVYVSGTIGDAALGLAPAARCGAVRALHPRSRRASAPRREVLCAATADSARAVVRDAAAAAMDVSDGLVKDFGRLCRSSGVGGRIEAQRVPLSEETQGALAMGVTTLDRLITGGEDYEVLAAVRPQRAAEFERLAYAVGTRRDVHRHHYPTGRRRRRYRCHRRAAGHRAYRLGSLFAARCALNTRLGATKSHRVEVACGR